MKILRDYFFQSIDSILPRSIASIPYQEAFNSCAIALSDSEVELWHRNSFKLGNYTFGTSDLDLTLLFHHWPTPVKLKKTLEILANQKRIFPFIGETNIYIDDEVGEFLSCFNYFERLRDPIFCDHFLSDKKSSQSEKTAFVLRMLFSDRVKLTFHPELRQRKWQFHFSALELPYTKLIKKDTIDSILSKWINTDISAALEILDTPNLTDDKIFGMDLPEEWKFLFPNKYLWFHQGQNEKFDFVSDKPELRDVCLAQIRWEVWGIFSQLPFLVNNEEGLNIHLYRMSRVANALGDYELSAKVQKLQDLSYKFIKNYST